MVKKIDDKVVRTALEARKKYKKKFICMVITKSNLMDSDNEEGYVLYISDSESEIYSFSTEGYEDVKLSIIPGYAVGRTKIKDIYFN